MLPTSLVQAGRSEPIRNQIGKLRDPPEHSLAAELARVSVASAKQVMAILKPRLDILNDVSRGWIRNRMLSHITAVDRVARDLDAYGLRYLLAINFDNFEVQIWEARKKREQHSQFFGAMFSRDISQGWLRDKMLTQLDTIEAKARDVYVRD